MLKNTVYEAIKQRILVGHYKAGDLLNERALMEEYGIGKSPLREVFFSLQHDGLIRRYSRIGTVVAPIDTKKLRDVVEVRHHLEAIVASLAVKRISDKTLEEMGAGLQRMEDAVQANDHTAFAAEEANLHNLLYTATDNMALKEFIESQYSLFTRVWFSVERSPIDMMEPFKDWQAIYQALCEKNEKKVVESNRRHFKKYFNLLRTV